MMYFLYVIIGILIVLGVDIALTVVLAVNDARQYYKQEHVTFTEAFKKYFWKNNNLPTKMSDLFS